MNRLLLAVAAAVLTSCYIPAQSSASKSVSTAGGSIALEGVTLDVPPGALSADTTISVTEVFTPATINGQVLSPLYEFGPPGLTFGTPARVSFKVTGALPLSAGVQWSSDGGNFEKLATTVDGDVASARVSHFSRGFVGAVVPAFTASIEMLAEPDAGPSAVYTVRCDSGGASYGDFVGPRVQAFSDSRRSQCAVVAPFAVLTVDVGVKGFARAEGFPVGVVDLLSPVAAQTIDVMVGAQDAEAVIGMPAPGATWRSRNTTTPDGGVVSGTLATTLTEEYRPPLVESIGAADRGAYRFELKNVVLPISFERGSGWARFVRVNAVLWM